MRTVRLPERAERGAEYSSAAGAWVAGFDYLGRCNIPQSPPPVDHFVNDLPSFRPPAF
jgi:hypothetical protein